MSGDSPSRVLVELVRAIPHLTESLLARRRIIARVMVRERERRLAGIWGVVLERAFGAVRGVLTAPEIGSLAERTRGTGPRETARDNDDRGRRRSAASCRALAASIESARASSARTPRGWALRYCESRPLARSASPLPRRARMACSTGVGSSPPLGGVATLVLGSTTLAADGAANGSAEAQRRPAAREALRWRRRASAGRASAQPSEAELPSQGSTRACDEHGSKRPRPQIRPEERRPLLPRTARSKRPGMACVLPTRARRRCISNGCGSARGVARMAAARKCSAERGSWTVSTSRFTSPPPRCSALPLEPRDACRELRPCLVDAGPHGIQGNSLEAGRSPPRCSRRSRTGRTRRAAPPGASREVARGSPLAVCLPERPSGFREPAKDPASESSTRLLCKKRRNHRSRRKSRTRWRVI